MRHFFLIDADVSDADIIKCLMCRQEGQNMRLQKENKELFSGGILQSR